MDEGTSLVTIYNSNVAQCVMNALLGGVWCLSVCTVWIRTFEEGARLPDGDDALAAVLAEGELEEHEGEADEGSEDEVDEEEGACNTTETTVRHRQTAVKYALSSTWTDGPMLYPRRRGVRDCE